MLTLFGKKKLTEEKAANIFVNATQRLIDEGFESVAAIINDSSEFVQRPKVNSEDVGPFALIVIAGNLQNVPAHFDAGQDKRVAQHILDKFADIYEIDNMRLAEMVSETRKLMMRKNHPSKNVPTAMAKALFCKYGLNSHQEAYFKTLQAPNPIFIQRLREALETFLWDWDSFLQRYKLTA